MNALNFREGQHGYELLIGSFRIPQSTYLLATAIVVGVAGGYGAIGFRTLIGLEAELAGALTRVLAHVVGPFALAFSVACGGAAAAWLAARFAPEARGHGVPEVMAAVALHGGVMRPRVILVKALASATTIGFGGAAGREGPIVQIGSAIGSVLGQLAKAPAPIVRTLVACGAAAGISATFNAPIGGVFFASEVILGDFAPRSFAVIVVASVVSAVIGRTAFGDRPSFDASAFMLVSPRELWLYALLGVTCACFAAVFVKLLYRTEDFVDRLTLPTWLKGFAGFGVLGLIGVAVPQILGVGYDTMQHVLDGHVAAGRALEIAILKPIATSITLASGGSGGVFAPSLFTGAMLGDAFGRVVHSAFPLWTGPAAAYGLVAMAAFFAAASEAPITSIMIVFEMSDNYTIILPLMIATVVAAVLGRRLIAGTVYELKLMRRGIDWKRVRQPHALAHYRLEQIAHEPEKQRAAEPTAPFVLRGEDTLERAAEVLVDPSIDLVRVLDGSGHFIGVVTRQDVLARMRRTP